MGGSPPPCDDAGMSFQIAGDYALDGYRSVADVVDPESLQKVREFKAQKKAAGKASAG